MRTSSSPASFVRKIIMLPSLERERDIFLSNDFFYLNNIYLNNCQLYRKKTSRSSILDNQATSHRILLSEKYTFLLQVSQKDLLFINFKVRHVRENHANLARM